MDKKKQTCCFVGHRNIPHSEYNNITNKLKRLLIELINQGIIYFAIGGDLGFDAIAAKIILELKQIYPKIKLILVIPYKKQTKGWREEDIKFYKDIKAVCDRCIYTSDIYSNYCIFMRNRRLLDNSSICICYYRKKIIGTAYTVKYAKNRGLIIYNIADMI